MRVGGGLGVKGECARQIVTKGVVSGREKEER